MLALRLHSLLSNRPSNQFFNGLNISARFGHSCLSLVAVLLSGVLRLWHFHLQALQEPSLALSLFFFFNGLLGDVKASCSLAMLLSALCLSFEVTVIFTSRSFIVLCLRRNDNLCWHCVPCPVSRLMFLPSFFGIEHECHSFYLVCV